MASEDLYHVKRIMVDHKNDPTGALQKVDIRGTYTDLSNAKAAAKNALFEEGYEKEWFTVYDVRDGQDDWKHGDGFFVYAKAPEGEVFTVGLETAPNHAKFIGNDAGKVESEMYHVLQTTIHYNIDRSGASRDTSLEGTFRTFDEAKKAALTCLLDEDIRKENFVEFDEYTGQDDWAYGEDTMVHAVAQGGENSLVQVIKKP